MVKFSKEIILMVAPYKTMRIGVTEAENFKECDKQLMEELNKLKEIKKKNMEDIKKMIKNAK